VVLILEVTSAPASGLGTAARHTFDSGGGTIGRDRGNSWVLPHPKVSGRHAVITYAAGVFYIEDTSRNGVCLNSSRNRLVRGEPQPLTSGDRLLIEPYEIVVSVQSVGVSPSDRAATPGDDDPFGLFGNAVLDDPFAPPPASPRRAHVEPPRPNRSSNVDSPEPVASDELDPLALLNLTGDRPAPRKPAPSVQDLQSGSVLEAHFRPPAAVPDPLLPSIPAGDPLAIPQDYDPLAPDEPAPPPPPARPRAPAARPAEPPASADVEPRPLVRPRVGGRPPAIDRLPRDPVPPPMVDAAAPVESVAPPPRAEATPDRPPAAAAPPPAGAPVPVGDLAAVLAGAGLDPAAVTPELARAFGRILRVVVSGVMDVLQSRREIKDEFRMRMTQFRPRENNPLKFSANVEDALHNLLVKRNAAYLGPVEAFEDAFAELRHHQVAMLAGMRVAFEAMLAEFDPDRLQEDFDRQASKGLVPAKLRYWDLYREKRRGMEKDPEATFRDLFGDAFARAYEQQLQQLRARESAAPPPKTPTES
jgi:type VI secretion system FHA domain protein